MIDVRKFCAMPSTDHRAWLHAPAMDENFIYGCDGCRAIRLSRAGYENVTSKPDVSLVNLFKHAEVLTFNPLPDFTLPQTQPCTTCSNTGLVDVCTDCNGSGERVCSCCNNESDCEECDQGAVHGNSHCCPNCKGIGKQITGKDHIHEAVYFFDTYVHHAYLSALLALDELSVAPPTNPVDPISFRFKGGYALIMPRRK